MRTFGACKVGANFVWAQRFVQVSLIAPDQGFGSAGRAIPVDFVHAPSARKPRKDATEEERSKYKADQKDKRVSKVGAQRIKALREQLSKNPASENRKLVTAVDGGYTNREVFRSIPANTEVIGRIRKDAKLFKKPDIGNGRGRKRVYGEQVQTPEAMRQDDTIAWKKITAYGAGAKFVFDVKIIGPLRWKSSGDRDLQLMIVRPIGYRRTQRSKLLYREPAYLICTDDQMPAEQLLQAFLWRWEIEVNFREEKTLLGLGQAQVRTQAAVEKTSAFIVACYATMHAAATSMNIVETGLPLPRWRKHAHPARCTTNQLISRIRAEMWGKALGTNINGFASAVTIQRSLQNSDCKLGSAVLYATQ